jgi:hypothetical protein
VHALCHIEGAEGHHEMPACQCCSCTRKD